ncbi:hypothetical protein [Shinella zoogloeoides]|uniref:hypothetical protein n=1 Tax=Shinella zoogloeoides TaxID=352475 RepID=UPI00273E12EF|nr:hypothetical protein [Shinella zoogloeoides]WLR90939.1 hypothetical protein Q9316_00755 [Shinella zoogloeoides]
MIDVSTFGWPQWLILTWVIFVILAVAANHGKTFPVRAPRVIIIWLIILIVLALGGFFHG